MNKRLLIGLALAALAFCVAWLALVEVAFIPLGTLIGALMVYGRYFIDRFCYDEVNTIEFLKSDARIYDSYMRQYTWLIIAAFVIAAIVTLDPLGSVAR